ncbi:hypothetical protein HD553DRAFT_305717 [Filobasidium floriforme]|uniref:uncharacterized protein n=1 Tax=Filobasidium floriforme TaxID=5210 RepID=UPI001E8D989E|nr:uncharacterized protein HD553DRAFT_305717 [Filobasidium floriforme]KAH8089314.1 hypothetical protein HD553DRAFT_305717 [Filobasidium floriforme]
MGILSWFNPFAYGKKPPTDYDSLLSQLATEITTAKQLLAEIHLRQRRLSLLLNLYGVGLWGIWVGLCWLGGIPWGLLGLGPATDGSTVDSEGWRKGLEWGGVVGWPIILYLLNRLLSTYYTRRRTHEQQHLLKLLKRQHELLEEVKRKSGWYKTKDLLDRYEEGGSVRASARPTPGQVQGQARGQQPNTPTPASRLSANQNPNSARMQIRSPANPNLNINPNANANIGARPGQPGTPMTPNMATMSPQQLRILDQAREQVRDGPGVLPVPQKRWYDHLADKLMGEDPSTSLQNKYALVCGRCFRHNGLVGDKIEWENTKWYCRHCNFFNAAPKDRHGPATGSVELDQHAAPAAPESSVDVMTPRKTGPEAGSIRQRTKGKGDSEDKMDVDEEESS